MQLKIRSQSQKETLLLGKKIAQILKGNTLICLFGELGSGKTTLTKGIAQGLGINKNKIISPSFVLAREYKFKRTTLYHLDLYRLKRINELYSLGYENYLYPNGITIIEWADRIEGILPKEFLKIELEHLTPNERLIKLIPKGKRYINIVNNYADIRD